MLGQQVGQYHVTERLGEGGMGAVYLAQHTLIGRQAAIKVLKSEYSHNPEVVERFFNEARAASAIRHPGIVEIYDFGYHTDKSAYIVMEHLQGESLQDRMQRLRRLPAAHALNLIRQVASGLAAAHDQGIVHRDLKPDNIFVVPDPDMPGGERTKILDFGIAKLAVQEGPGSYRTSTGTVMGTPAYMAPEQCKGAGRVDHRTDIYALGCILFEMLCGRPPFVAEGGGEVMAQHIYELPPSPLAFEPGTPLEVDAFVGRLLAKEVDQRVQTSRDVLDLIDSMAHVNGAYPRADSRPVLPAAGTPLPAGRVQDSGPRSPETTLGAAVGSLPPTTQRRSRATFVAPLLAALVLGLGGIIFAVTRNGGQEQAASDDDATEVAPAAGTTTPVAVSSSMDAGAAAGHPASIEVVIESVPRGADVYQQPTGTRVGTTPFRDPRLAARGELVFVIKKAGYRTEKVVVPADSSSMRKLTLKRRSSSGKDRPAASADSSKPDKGQPAGSDSKKPDKKAKEGRSLDPFEKKKKGDGRALNPFEK